MNDADRMAAVIVLRYRVLEAHRSGGPVVISAELAEEIADTLDAGWSTESSTVGLGGAPNGTHADDETRIFLRS